MRRLFSYFAITAAVVTTSGCGDIAARQQAIERAEAQVQRIAAGLDQRTTVSGVYIRAKAGEIQEKDPWNGAIEVSYAQGGVAETVSVRSAGPDREFHTDDDIVAQESTTNLKGIGEGIKQNTEDVAAKAAKGFIKGAVEGVKDALPRKSKEDKSGQETGTK